MTKKNVVVTDYNFPSLEMEHQVAERYGASFHAFQCKSEEETIEAVSEADVVLAQFAPVTRTALERMAPGAAIIRYGIGYDNIDVSAARELGITAAYIPDYCVEEVADHTAALILASARKLLSLDQSVRRGEWSVNTTVRYLPAFSKTTIGFLGMGRIGHSVMRRLQPFQFSFLAMDPALDSAQSAAFGIELVNREVLLQRSDILSLHAPATTETNHFINRDSLLQMKSTAIIVNTARGKLIDEEALAEALRLGRLGGAALDVFDQEPPAMSSSIRNAPNTILTPHAAWYSNESLARLQSLAAEDLARLLSGLQPRYSIPGSL